MFDDVLEANRRYADGFALAGVRGKAARGLAVVTCMDTRIDPLSMLGLVPGDAKIVRNAGGRATDDVLRGLVLATNLLDVDRVAIIHHTHCAMVSTNEDIAAAVGAAGGTDVTGWDFCAIADPDADLAADVARVRDCPLINTDVLVTGWRYDVETGLVQPVVS